MAGSSYPIQVLAEMVEEFDEKEPKSGRETTAFIKRWKAKELEEHHGSQTHLDIAVRSINRAEIQNIRETKHFRDEQKDKKKKPQREGGRIGGKASAKTRRAKPKVKAVLARNVIW